MPQYNWCAVGEHAAIAVRSCAVRLVTQLARRPVPQTAGGGTQLADTCSIQGACNAPNTNCLAFPCSSVCICLITQVSALTCIKQPACLAHSRWKRASQPAAAQPVAAPGCWQAGHSRPHATTSSCGDSQRACRADTTGCRQSDLGSCVFLQRALHCEGDLMGTHSAHSEL